MQLPFRGHLLELDPSGALWWPARSTLVVADLHLEKGAAFARRGSMLPPYDTHATLDRVEALVARFAPETVVSLGDGFHDRAGPTRLAADLVDRLGALAGSRRWIWITGNHDPAIPVALGGACVPELELEGLWLRHIPTDGKAGEITGHLHPKARVVARGRTLSRPCFLADEARLLLPALGSFTGGLNVLDPEISGLFSTSCSAFVLGESRVFRFPREVLAPDHDPLQHRL